MFFGIQQAYSIDIYRFYFEKYMLGYLTSDLSLLKGCLIWNILLKMDGWLFF